jgi:hypothetical protein
MTYSSKRNGIQGIKRCRHKSSSFLVDIISLFSSSAASGFRQVESEGGSCYISERYGISRHFDRDVTEPADHRIIGIHRSKPKHTDSIPT